MVLNPPEPDPAKVRVLGFRNNEGIFDGYPRLVVVAVEHPLLKLRLRQLPVVHELMERMMVMVADGTFAPEPFHKGFFRKRISVLFFHHNVISIPSQATLHPSASTSSRS